MYLLCWGLTWAFAPAAVVRWWADQKATTTDHMGNVVPVEFRAGSRFVGAGFNYWPAPIPESR